ncbi:MAG: MFS transporter [Verrucomicrobiota bacterium]|nr:MFS transporter [Verrucomicrobiota bacterium]
MASTTPPKKENLWLNLAFHVAAPALILSKLSGQHALGPVWGLIVALAFPLGYGIWDLAAREKTNFISILGFVSVLLSGGLGLMKVGGLGFAVKDAAIPALIGVAVLASLRTREPLLKTLFYNETIIDVPRIEAVLHENGSEAAFAKLMRQATMLVAASFFISGGLNFILARHLLRSPGGTPEFNAELAKMHWLSWPVIVVPSMVMMMIALWRLVKGLESLTGLSTDEVFRAEEKVRRPTSSLRPK